MYRVIKDIYANEEKCNYVSYGIATDGYVIDDISTNVEDVEKLVHLCNTYGLSIIHLMDVVEDWVVGL